MGAVIAACIFIVSIVATGLPGADHVILGPLTRDDLGEGCRDMAGLVGSGFLGGRHRAGDGRTSTGSWLQSDREVVATAEPVSPMRLGGVRWIETAST
jgi:hypothetical protein